MTHWHGRRDLLHRDVGKRFRAAAWFAFDTADRGDGFPDWLVCSPAGRVVLVEVKSPGGVLTDDEVKFSEEYPGEYATVYRLDDVDRITREGATP
jgi:hypothetical protein